MARAIGSPPRHLTVALPFLSCYGKRPKVERWRGVNGQGYWKPHPPPPDDGSPLSFLLWQATKGRAMEGSEWLGLLEC